MAALRRMRRPAPTTAPPHPGASHPRAGLSRPDDAPSSQGPCHTYRLRPWQFFVDGADSGLVGATAAAVKGSKMNALFKIGALIEPQLRERAAGHAQPRHEGLGKVHAVVTQQRVLLVTQAGSRRISAIT